MPQTSRKPAVIEWEIIPGEAPAVQSLPEPLVEDAIIISETRKAPAIAPRGEVTFGDVRREVAQNAVPLIRTVAPYAVGAGAIYGVYTLLAFLVTLQAFWLAVGAIAVSNVVIRHIIFGKRSPGPPASRPKPGAGGDVITNVHVRGAGGNVVTNVFVNYQNDQDHE